MNQTTSKPTNSHAEAATLEPVILDCDHILTHAGGDPELLIQLCATFLNEIPVRLEALRSAVAEGNSFLTERALQQLRNCLMVFGAGPVSFTAEILETAVRGGRARQIRREWKHLDRQVQILVPQVQRLMLEMSNPRGAVQ